MRIYFSGSARHGESDAVRAQPVQLFDAARQLGRETARRGHAILLASDKPMTLDPYVVEGAGEFASQAFRAEVEVHRLGGHSSAFASASGVRLVRVSYDHMVLGAERRLGGRAGAVGAADAVVLVGGSETTRMVGRLAQRVGKPVVPVGCFGGAGEEALRRLEPVFRRLPDKGECARLLAAPWDDTASAARVLDLVQVLAGRHSYYLSAAPADELAADHVEVLLRRCAREVLRALRAAPDPQGPPRAADLAEADSVVMLWSRAAAASVPCAEERMAAATLIDQGAARPRRMTFLRLDDAPLPPGFEHLAQGEGGSREARAREVMRWIAGESAAVRAPAP